MEETIDVLLVEDTSTQAIIMQQRLVAGGYTVKIKKSAEEALSFLSENKASYVLTDINLPEMDGYELAKKIKSEPNGSEIVVVLLVTLKDVEDLVDILNSEADSLMLKELRREYFLSAFQNIAAASLKDEFDDAMLNFTAQQRNVSKNVRCKSRSTVNMLSSCVHALVHHQRQLAESAAK